MVLQLGLNFGDALPELFGGKEMGEDALRVLEAYLVALATIRRDVASELPTLRAAGEQARLLAGSAGAARRSQG